MLPNADPASNEQRAALLEHALAYASRGWSIIPVVGKEAAGLWKPFQTRPADDNTLRRLFARRGITGLAVVLGRVSAGLAVRDFDDAGAYHAWAAQNADDVARLPTVKTARGYHVYGRLDEETFAALGDGELRGDSGHYVLLPPSWHPDGATYAWTVPLPGGKLPPLPPSLGPTQQKQAEAADPGTPSTNTAWWTSAVSRTLPTGPGQRNRRLFDLARILKAIQPDAAPDLMREIVREWCRQALPRTSGTHGFGDCWADFITAWGRVKRPAGNSFALAAAAAEAEEPAVVRRLGYDGPLRRLAALCWQLARPGGDRPFPLGCEIAGRHLGVSTRHAGRLLKTLQIDGVLRLMKKGTKASKKASEWQYTAGT
jgi:hypothetical protein